MKITARPRGRVVAASGWVWGIKRAVRAVTNKWHLYRMYRIAHTRRQAIVWMLERESF